jgi:hypothetical protein
MIMKTSLIVAVGVALALPFGAVFAQSADVAYCKQLSSLYREVNRGADPTGAGAQAMSQCDTNPGAGIPFLEKSLTDAKVSLPPKPMAFNPKAYTNMADCLTAAAAARAPLNLCGPKQGM